MAEIPKVILLIETSREYGRALLRGIAQYSRLHGPWTFSREPLFYTEPARRKRAFSRLKNWNADGIIMREPGKNEEILALSLPTVVSPYSTERIPGVPNIISDNDAMAEMAARHLLDRGFQHFAYCGFDDMFFSIDRGEKFRRHIDQAGCQTHFYKQPRPRNRRLWEDEQHFMVEWLKSLPKPVGLMTCNDDRSQHVIDACKIADICVPDQLAVIGVDNDDLICDLSNPPLSSIALNTVKAGYQAAAALHKLMAGDNMNDHIITVSPTHVVARQSTDILAIQDNEVAEAVRFIHLHAKEPVQVDEVVDAVALSRRSLEQRFRRVLGRSIHREIRRVRVEQVIRMLLETNMSISQIALALGYPGINNVARYFRQETRISPIAYRKIYTNK